MGSAEPDARLVRMAFDSRVSSECLPRESTMPDLHAIEQGHNLRAHLLRREGKKQDQEWSSNGTRSVAPFVPCASARIGPLVHAAKLTNKDVLWDLGCGDGTLLHAAAALAGCQCVGIDIDQQCIEEAKLRADEQGCSNQCTFLCADLFALSPDASAPLPDVPAPTCCFIFLTGHGLSRLEPLLWSWWQRGGLRLFTCVESLDEAVDFEAGLCDLFEPNVKQHGWPISRTFDVHGVYGVPPLGTSILEWDHIELRREEWTRAQTDESEPCLVRNILSENEVASLSKLGSEMIQKQSREAPSALDIFENTECGQVEEFFHAANEHSVIYLHRDHHVQNQLPRLVSKIFNRMRKIDAKMWGLLTGRAVTLRSVEYHSYKIGGSVSDLDHRDAGSLLTLSVLLSNPHDFEGGTLFFPGTESVDDSNISFHMRRGDGVLFPSEKRHNVTPVSAGVRESFVVELWDGPPNKRNRHE